MATTDTPRAAWALVVEVLAELGRAWDRAAQPTAGAQAGVWVDAAGQCPAVPSATAGQENAPAGESGRGEEGEGHRQCPSTPEV